MNLPRVKPDVKEIVQFTVEYEAFATFPKVGGVIFGYFNFKIGLYRIAF